MSNVDHLSGARYIRCTLSIWYPSPIAVFVTRSLSQVLDVLANDIDIGTDFISLPLPNTKTRGPVHIPRTVHAPTPTGNRKHARLHRDRTALDYL